MADMIEQLRSALKAYAMSLPGAHGKSPWPGHDDVAVKDKTFLYLSSEGEPFKVSVKLPYTGEVVLDLPFAEPTGYGLGKSGWVTLTPSTAQMPSLKDFKEWTEQSYRAQAPKKLVKELDDPERD